LKYYYIISILLHLILLSLISNIRQEKPDIQKDSIKIEIIDVKKTDSLQKTGNPNYPLGLDGFIPKLDLSKPENTNEEQINENLLKNKDFVYQNYFDRIRAKLDAAWRWRVRDLVRRLWKQGRHRELKKAEITKAIIVLNDKGVVIKIKILQKAGMRELDQVVVDAFNEVQYFPNPPKGLAHNGIIEIPWQFIVWRN